MAEETRREVTPDDVQKFKDYATAEAIKAGKPPHVVLGLIDAESDWDPYAVSPTGATGLGQFTKATAAKHGMSPEDRIKPAASIRGVIGELNDIEAAYPDLSWKERITAYNAGIEGYRLFREGKFDEIVKHIKDPEAKKARIDEIRNFSSRVEGKIANYYKVDGQQLQQPDAQQAVNPAATEVASPSASMTPSPTPSATPEPSRMEVVQQVGTDVAKLVDPLAKSIYHNVVEPGVEAMTAFPGQLQDASRAIGNNTFNSLIESIGGTPPAPDMPIPYPNPMDAFNFGSALFPGSPARFGPWATRAFQATRSAGEVALNIANEKAMNRAREAGLDPTSMGPVALTDLIMEEIDTTEELGDLIASNAPALLLSGAVGGVLGSKDPKLGPDGKPWHTATDREIDVARDYNKVFDENTMRIENAQLMTAADRHKRDLENAKLREENWMYNTQQLAAEMTNAANDDAYARRIGPILKQKADLEERFAMLDKLPENASDLEKWAANQQARDFVRSQFGLPDEDPSKPFFKKLVGDWQNPSPIGMRPLDPKSVETINVALDSIRAEAKKAGLLESEFGKLGRHLGNIDDLQPEIDKYTAIANNKKMSAIKRAQAEAKVKALEAEIQPPTVVDLVYRLQAIDALRRNKDFIRSNSEGRRLSDFLDDLSIDLRAPGGIGESAMLPDEVEMWTTGNMLSRTYNEQLRTHDLIMEHFQDVQPGYHTLRNGMKKDEKLMRKRLGDANYEHLYDLSVSLDTLRAALPEPPKRVPFKGYEAPVETPYDPAVIPKLKEYPDVDAALRPPESSEAQKQTANYAARMANFAVRGTLSTAAYHKGKQLGEFINRQFGLIPEDNEVPPPEFIHEAFGLTGAALGFLITSKAGARAFGEMMRHIEKPEGKPFRQAAARLITAGTIHRSMAGPARQPAPAVTPAPPPEPQPEPGPSPVPPSIPTRPTSSRIPAPPPTSSRLPAGAPPVL